MAGAHVVGMTSALLKNGIGHLGKVTKDLVDWRELDGRTQQSVTARRV
jgi:dihydroorotate dehydrogenase